MDPSRIADILEALRAAGYRVTTPRRAVAHVLADAGDWLPPDEVQRRARRHAPSIGLVTVYRTLSLFTELGFVRRIHLEDGCTGYARSDLSHGHHLVCRSCRQVVEFPGVEDLRPLIRRVERRTGYRIEDHMLELLGLCQRCQTAPGWGA